MHRRLGRDNLWHIAAHWRNYTLDDLCDVVEFIHDHVSRPMSRNYHSYAECGYHYSNFRRDIAQQLYRAQINIIFADGDDRLVLNGYGRFEEVVADALEPLISGARSDVKSGDSQHDEFQHAIESFRRRGASVPEKRAAIVTLAGVLEERRALVKDKLLG